MKFGEYGAPLARAVSRYLTAKAGFNRVGDRVVGLDEGILPNFVRADLVIEAGWDNWSGEYLLANSADRDAIIQEIFGAIRLDHSFNPDAPTLLPEKKQLQEAQRLWIKYVEANCDFYDDPNGGTAARMMPAQCSVDARAQRAGELADLAKWN